MKVDDGDDASIYKNKASSMFVLLFQKQQTTQTKNNERRKKCVFSIDVVYSSVCKYVCTSLLFSQIEWMALCVLSVRSASIVAQ